MAFLKTALEMARTAVYSLHKSSTREVSSNHHNILCYLFLNSWQCLKDLLSVLNTKVSNSPEIFKHLAVGN